MRLIAQATKLYDELTIAQNAGDGAYKRAALRVGPVLLTIHDEITAMRPSTSEAWRMKALYATLDRGSPPQPGRPIACHRLRRRRRRPPAGGRVVSGRRMGRRNVAAGGAALLMFATPEMRRANAKGSDETLLKLCSEYEAAEAEFDRLNDAQEAFVPGSSAYKAIELQFPLLVGRIHEIRDEISELPARTADGFKGKARVSLMDLAHGCPKNGPAREGDRVVWSLVQDILRGAA
jgi:hypothetical protein